MQSISLEPLRGREFGRCPVAHCQRLVHRLTNTSAMKAQTLIPPCSQIRRTVLVTALAGATVLVRAAETPPKPLFPDAAPVCPCASLAKVSLPNTTIDSAAIDA